MRVQTRPILIGTAVVIVVAGGLAWEVVSTRPVRESVRTYSLLISVANRPDLPADERIASAQKLCSAHYVKDHAWAVASEGGLIGLPRNINKNFRAWREGPNVWICPTNRIGPIYQFVEENGQWKYDGLVGLLRPWGEVVPATELPDAEDGEPLQPEADAGP